MPNCHSWKCSRLQNFGVEPVLALYMFTSFVKYPIFQSLLYEKSCIARYQDEEKCTNTSSIHSDVNLQSDANRLFLYSSICLLLPSIPVSLALGSLCDIWSAKLPILLPLFGLVLGDVNYIFQCSYFEADPRWLLLSDLLSGFTGGYSGLLGMMFSYTTKLHGGERTGQRIALLEGSIGIGATVGYALSGVIRQELGFSQSFLLLLGFRTICFLYVLAFVKDIVPVHESESRTQSDGIRLAQGITRRLVDARDVLCKYRPSRISLWLTLVALGFELLSFAGINDIQYSFFRFKLKWTDKEYGWYSGVIYALSTVTVLVIYPCLRSRGVLDLTLCSFALIVKVISVLATGFVFQTWFAFAITPLSSFNRFIATALRTTASQAVDLSEQGKVFSVMSIMDGTTSLCGSLIFNSIYPLTLPYYSYLCFIVISLLLVVSLIVTLFLLRIKKKPPSIPLSQSSGSVNS